MVLFTILRRFFNYLALANARREAIRLHNITRKKYYVLKVRNKIRVYDRRKINMLIDKGILSKLLRDVLELHKFSLYFTGQPKHEIRKTPTVVK